MNNDTINENPVKKSNRSKVRLMYMLSYAMAILCFVAGANIVETSPNGQLTPEGEIYFYIAGAGLFFFLVVTMFVVRCGNCGFGLWAAARRVNERKKKGIFFSFRFSISLAEALSIILRKNCPSCDIERV